MIFVARIIILNFLIFVSKAEFEISKAILDEVVKNRFGPSATIISAEISEFSNRTVGASSKQHFLTVSVSDESGNEIQDTFFLKTHLKKNLLTTAVNYDRMFLSEAKFYSQENPLLSKNIYMEPWLPRSYSAHKDIIILENLENSGFKAVKGILSFQEL